MNVLAKFRVTEKSQGMNTGFSVKLEPVTTGSEENKEFYKYTPHGEFKLNTVSENVFNSLELEKEYYITISKERLV